MGGSKIYKRQCVICGKEFHTNRFWQKTCSGECRRELRHMRDVENRRKRLGRSGEIEKVCIECGKVFKTFRKQQKYCSKECKHVARARFNYHFEKAKKMIKDKKCIVCGFDKVIEYHHIIPYSEGGTNDVENIAVLCPNHHKMIHKYHMTLKELKEAYKNGQA